MKQDIKHVNYVWGKMRKELPIRTLTSNYMEVVTRDYEYSMHIILVERHNFLATVFFEHNFDEKNTQCRTWITGMGRSFFCSIDWLRDVAYDFADMVNPKKQTLDYSPFWELYYPELLEDEREQVRFIKGHHYPKKGGTKRIESRVYS